MTPDLKITTETGGTVEIYVREGRVECEDLGKCEVEGEIIQPIIAVAKEMYIEHAKEGSSVVMKRLSDNMMVDPAGVVWNRGGTVLNTMGAPEDAPRA